MLVVEQGTKYCLKIMDRSEVIGSFEFVADEKNMNALWTIIRRCCHFGPSLEVNLVRVNDE